MRRVAWLALAAACGGGTATPTNAPATTAAITRGAIHERVLLTGELRAGQAIEIAVPRTETFELTIRWMADDGAVVKKGDRLLEFDNSAFLTGLEQKRVAAKEAATQFATARDVANMAIAEKQFELDQAKNAAEKAAILAGVPADLLPQRTAQERQLEKTKADVAVERAKKELAAQKETAALEARVKQIELEKAKHSIEDAETALAQLVALAPRDGVVSIGTHPWEDRRFQIGDTVQPGMTVVTLPDFTQPMEVRAELSDVDDGRVALGMSATCTLDAYPREPLPCKLVELAPVARTRSRQSLRRGFAVKLAIENRDPQRMRPGMSVKVEVPRPVIDRALLVPRGAIRGNGSLEVQLASGEVRAISIGACDPVHCEVQKGLAEGDRVILLGGGGS